MTARTRLKAAVQRVARVLPRKPRPAILMYHRLGSESFDPWGLTVEHHRFAEQMEWLAGNRAVLPLDEFAQRHREGRLPAEAVALTFDDGYSSVLGAVPVLERHGLHATVFIPVALIERGRAFWWDELAELILGWRAEDLGLDGERLPVPAAREEDRIWPPDHPPRTPRQQLFQSLWSKLYAVAPAAQEGAMDQVRSQAEIVPPTIDRPLTPDGVRSAPASTIAFGSHGLTHASLPALCREDREREMEQSRDRCAAMTGTPPTAFAYPYGDLDAASVGLAERAGYACACATGDRFVTARSNPFALPRLRAGNWDAAALRDMLAA